MNRLFWVILVFVFLVSVLGCDEEEKEEEGIIRLEEMEQEILDYVGSPSCDSIGSCRWIGMGDKPCGGPWYILVYSISDVDSLVLGELVSAYNDYNGELNQEYGWISDCSVPNDPQLECQNGICVDTAN